MKNTHPPQTPPTYTVPELIKAAYHDNEPWVSGFERAYLAILEKRKKLSLHKPPSAHSSYSNMIASEIDWRETGEGWAYWYGLARALENAGK
jgi:hypothetical protein